jgi:hypothetical protein
MVEPGRKLAQIATNSQDLGQMTREVDQLAATYGEDRKQVADMMFSARSENFTEAVPDIVKYGDIVDMQSQATVAGQVPGLFQGKISSREAMSATLAAAKDSRLNYEGIAGIMPTIAGGASLIGASPEEAFAAASVFPSGFKSGEEASTMYSSMAAKMNVRGIQGEGFAGKMETLMGMPDAERRDFLQESKELNVGYQKFSQMLPMLKTRTAEIGVDTAATRDGKVNMLERQYREFHGDTATPEGKTRIALEKLRQATVMEEIAVENRLGLRGAGQQTAQARVAADVGGTMPGFVGKATGSAAATFLQTEEEGTERAGRAGAKAASRTARMADALSFGVFGQIADLLSTGNQQRANQPRSGSTALNAATLAGQQQR